MNLNFPYPMQTRYPDYVWVTAPDPDPANFSTNGSQPKTDGIDVSRYQEQINYQQCEADGVKFVVMRCTVGDYYKDTLFDINWQGFGQTNILRAPYIVVAPGWSKEWDYQPVSAQAHWDKFRQSFGDRVPELPVVLDCELTRNQSPAYISDLIDDLIWRINDYYGRMPIIYTRGNWWNENTIPKTSFGLCDLWIARYSETLEHPWEDNQQYKPRDWDEWTFWQYSEEGEIDGIPDSKVDLDWFNGTLEELLCYAEEETPAPPPVEPPPVPEVLYQVRVLSHLKYWNIRAHPANPAWAAKDMGDAYGGLELCVFEEQELDGYTWLRCGGDNFWLRSDGVERI